MITRRIFLAGVAVCVPAVAVASEGVTFHIPRMKYIVHADGLGSYCVDQTDTIPVTFVNNRAVITGEEEAERFWTHVGGCGVDRCVLVGTGRKLLRETHRWGLFHDTPHPYGRVAIDYVELVLGEPAEHQDGIVVFPA